MNNSLENVPYNWEGKMPFKKGKNIKEATFLIEVNYNLTLEQMVNGMIKNHYPAISPDFWRANFSIEGEGRVKRKLHFAHLKKNSTGDEIIAGLSRRDLRPPRLEELLAFGAAYHGACSAFGIYAIDSVWIDLNGERKAPCLHYTRKDGLILSLSSLDPTNCWFEDVFFGFLNK